MKTRCDGQPLKLQALPARGALALALVLLASTVEPSQGALRVKNASATRGNQEPSGCGADCRGRCFDGHCLFDDQGLSEDAQRDFENVELLDRLASAGRRSLLSKPSQASAEPDSAPAAMSADAAQAAMLAIRSQPKGMGTSVAPVAAASERAVLESEANDHVSATDQAMRADMEDYEERLQEFLSSGGADPTRSRLPGSSTNVKARRQSLLNRARNEQATWQRLQAAEDTIAQLSLQNGMLRQQLEGWRHAGARVAEREARVVQMIGRADRPATINAHSFGDSGRTSSATGSDAGTLYEDKSAHSSADEMTREGANSVVPKAAVTVLPAAPSAPSSIEKDMRPKQVSDGGPGLAKHTASLFGPREMLQLMAGKEEKDVLLPAPELLFFIEIVVVSVVLCAAYIFKGSLTTFLFGTEDIVKLVNFPRAQHSFAGGSSKRQYDSQEKFPTHEDEEALDDASSSKSRRGYIGQPRATRSATRWDSQELMPRK